MVDVLRGAQKWIFDTLVQCVQTLTYSCPCLLQKSGTCYCSPYRHHHGITNVLHTVYGWNECCLIFRRDGGHMHWFLPVVHSLFCHKNLITGTYLTEPVLPSLCAYMALCYNHIHCVVVLTDWWQRNQLGLVQLSLCCHCGPPQRQPNPELICNTPDQWICLCMEKFCECGLWMWCIWNFAFCRWMYTFWSYHPQCSAENRFTSWYNLVNSATELAE